MTATLTPDLLAHVAAVRDKAEPDDADLLALADHLAEAGDEDWAELLRLQVRKDQLNAVGVEKASNEEDAEFCEILRREGEIVRRNPAWLSVSDPPGGIPATITRGFLDVTLPHTLCWRRECSRCHETAWDRGAGCARCDGGPMPQDWSPHPVLRAVLASPVGPWVRRVRVEGVAPGELGGMWFWNEGDPRYDAANVPKPIWEMVKEDHSAAEAATDALARAVPIWARSAK
ncbi:MAG TPA: hypothetical protein VM529_08600 [Gemmata sp.]|nr:hypothetical protein [Gemmata sp.]